MAGTEATVTVKPLSAARLGDLAELFGTTKTTDGCYCMWFLLRAKECQAGWAGGNKTAFEALVTSDKQPYGLLAYRGREAVGWCAAGPRSRYQRALNGPILADHDPAEDDAVWLVPCFYVRRDARGRGVTRTLLEHAVDLARRHGAIAVEGFPLAGDDRHSASSAFLGVQPLFESVGFEAVARPTPKRVLMRLPLS